MINTFKKSAFTLMEAVICMLIVSVVGICGIVAFKPGKMQKEACQKAGLDAFYRIGIATKTILAKNSGDYTMLTLKNISGTAFNLSSTDKNKYISELYRQYLGKRGDSVTAEYTNTSLVNEAGTAVGSLKVSSFSNGIFIKNGTYMAFKLNSNCTTTETDTIYDPSVPDKHSQSNSCGLIFYDVNGVNFPNVLGVDMYIVSLGRIGLK